MRNMHNNFNNIKHAMLRCTYIIFIHNNEDNILNLVSSLKKLKGDFRKEFIFIDDGSDDDSLNLLKKYSSDISRSTIITQEEQGSSISINKAMNLVTGDYIQFVEGDEILHKDSTLFLLEACQKLNAQVAVGSVSCKRDMIDDIKCDATLIDDPIKAILNYKIPELQKIGKSASIIHKDLIKKTNKSDEEIYTHNMSLSLRCAKYSNFAYISNNISSVSRIKSHDNSKFISYNNLKSIYNFAIINPDLFSKLTTDLLISLSKESVTDGKKINYRLKAFFAKYTKFMSLDKVLNLYKQELDKLF